MLHFLSTHPWTAAALLLAVGTLLAVSRRDRADAAEPSRVLESKTVTQADLKLAPFVDGDKVRGNMAQYFNGPTAGTRELVTGQFQLLPGEEPHPPHTHLEEELLIVTSGEGEIVCDGKITRVEAGTVMYTAPHVPHGIKNTGKDVLTFYFIKWIASEE